MLAVNTCGNQSYTIIKGSSRAFQWVVMSDNLNISGGNLCVATSVTEVTVRHHALCQHNSQNWNLPTGTSFSVSTVKVLKSTRANHARHQCYTIILPIIFTSIEQTVCATNDKIPKSQFTKSSQIIEIGCSSANHLVAFIPNICL
jgi:hypothetical protein